MLIYVNEDEPLSDSALTYRTFSIHRWMRMLVEAAILSGDIPLNAPLKEAFIDEQSCEIALLILLIMDRQTESFSDPYIATRALEHAKRSCAWYGELREGTAEDLRLGNIGLDEEQQNEMLRRLNIILADLDRRFEENGLLYQPLLYRLFHRLSTLPPECIQRVWHMCGFSSAVVFAEVERYPLPLLAPILNVISAAGVTARWEYDPHGNVLSYLTLMDNADEGIKHIERVIPARYLFTRNMSNEEDAISQLSTHLSQGVGVKLSTQYCGGGANIGYVWDAEYHKSVERAATVIDMEQQQGKQVAVVVPYYDSVTEMLLERGGRDIVTNPPHRSLWSSPLIRSLYVLAHPAAALLPLGRRDGVSPSQWADIYATALQWAIGEKLAMHEITALARLIVLRIEDRKIKAGEAAKSLAVDLIAYSTHPFTTLSERLMYFLGNIAEKHGLRFIQDPSHRVLSYAFAKLSENMRDMASALGLDQANGFGYAFDRAFWELLSDGRLSRQMIGGTLQPLFGGISVPVYTAYGYVSSSARHDVIVVIGADHDSWFSGPRGEAVGIDNYLRLLRALSMRCHRLYLIGSDYDVRGMRAKNELLRAGLSIKRLEMPALSVGV